MNITLTDEQAEILGNKIIELFDLKEIKRGDDKGRYNTSWGTKTKRGVARTVMSIISSDSEIVNELKEILQKNN